MRCTQSCKDYEATGPARCRLSYQRSEGSCPLESRQRRRCQEERRSSHHPIRRIYIFLQGKTNPISSCSLTKILLLADRGEPRV